MEHKKGIGSVFTHKYNCKYLLYYECFSRIEEAILREKQMKKWKKEWKMNAIKSINPNFEDLTDSVKDML